MLWVQNYHFYIIQNNWDKYQYKNKKHSPPKHKQKFQKCIKSDGSTPLIIELGSQYITFVVPELSQGHKCSKHLKNLRGIKKKKKQEKISFLKNVLTSWSHRNNSWEATLRCWFRELKFRSRTSHFNHHNRVLIVHLYRDGRAFSFLIFLLLPDEIDGDAN